MHHTLAGCQRRNGDRRHALRTLANLTLGIPFGIVTTWYNPSRHQQPCPNQSPDGQIELDAIGEGSTPWLVEVKWRNRPVSRADIAAFAHKARSMVGHLQSESTPTLWMISGGGFKPSALDYAAGEGILVSGGQDMQKLAELLGVRFGK